MTIDPLYKIKNGWKIVYSPEELEKLLSSHCEEEIANTENDELNNTLIRFSWLLASLHCLCSFGKANVSNIN